MLKLNRKYITISMTAEDLAEGRRRQCLDDPLALAVRRLFPGRGVHVNARSALVFSAAVGPPPMELPWPSHVSEWVRAFDRGEDVGVLPPFTVEVLG